MTRKFAKAWLGNFIFSIWCVCGVTALIGVIAGSLILLIEKPLIGIPLIGLTILGCVSYGITKDEMPGARIFSLDI